MHEGTPTLQFHPHHLVTATSAVCPPRSLEQKFESKTWFTSVAPRTTATALGHTTFTRVSVDVSGPSLTREQPAPGGGGGGEARPGRPGPGLGVPGLDVMLKFCVALTAFTF